MPDLAGAGAMADGVTHISEAGMARAGTTGTTIHTAMLITTITITGMPAQDQEGHTMQEPEEAIQQAVLHQVIIQIQEAGRVLALPEGPVAL